MLLSSSMQWLLVSIKDAKDIDGVVSFVNGKGDEIRGSLHGFTSDVPVLNNGGGGQFSDVIKIVSYQVSEPVAQIGARAL
ncbi:MAG TPA: hypothetical protein VHC48_03340 [Puia sp.]|nr:hypothetical protein [Puia sp.]